MQESCHLQPARPPTEGEDTHKGLPRRSKVAALSAKKQVDIEEAFTDSKADNLEKE
jgi:hypothetical protein